MRYRFVGFSKPYSKRVRLGKEGVFIKELTLIESFQIEVFNVLLITVLNPCVTNGQQVNTGPSAFYWIGDPLKDSKISLTRVHILTGNQSIKASFNTLRASIPYKD